MARIATRLPGERNLAEEDRDRIAAIRGELIRIGNGWRERHPFLAAHQDGVGMAIFLASIAGVLVDAALYAAGILPWYATILITSRRPAGRPGSAVPRCRSACPRRPRRRRPCRPAAVRR